MCYFLNYATEVMEMIPLSLEQDYLNGKCVLFVGAGISARVTRSDGTRVPGWNEFVCQLITFAYNRDYFNEQEKTDLLNMVNSNKSISVAQIIIDELKESEFQAFLSSQFHGLEPTDPIYPLICKMKFRAIATTNYDTLIEDAFQRYALQKIPTWTQCDISENLLQIENSFLLKLHGTYERQSTVVLGLQGYMICIHKNHLLQELIESLLIANTFLFIGYSMTDPDMNDFIDYLNTICSGNNRSHYIAIEKGKVSSLERKYLRKHKNVNVLEYENKTGAHEGIIDLLEELKKKKSS